MLTAIKNDGRVGDFVHNGQTMAKPQGFGNVSKTWYDKTISYEAGLDLLEEGKHECEDITTQLKNIVPFVGNDGSFMVRVDGREFRPTPHATRHLAGVTFADCGVGTAESLVTPKMGTGKKADEVLYERDKGDAETLVRLINNGLRRKNQEKQFFLRTMTDGTLRAAFTERYATIDNRWYLEVLSKIVPGGRLSHWRGDAHTLYGNILVPDTMRSESDSDYGGGISISNCEIGIRAFDECPFTFRSICMNGNIWDRVDGVAVHRKHIGTINLVELAKGIAENITIQLGMVDKAIEAELASRNWSIGQTPIKSVYASVRSLYKLSRAQVTAALTGYGVEGGNTAFSVIQGLTRGSQKLSPADQFFMDGVAGKLLKDGEKAWEKTMAYANAMRPDDVDATFIAA